MLILAFIISNITATLAVPNLANSVPTNTSQIQDDINENDLANRKRIIAGALGLSFQEIIAVRERINALNIDEGNNLWTIRKTILEWLVNEESLFKTADLRLNADNLSLEEIQNIAKDIQNHRSANYNRNLANALDFIFAMEVSRFTDIAHDRFNRVNYDLQRIERAGLIRRNLFATEMAKARTMIDGAKVLTQRAITLSEAIYLPPAQNTKETIDSLSATTNKPTTATTEEAPVTTIEELSNSRSLSEAAIMNLRLAYGEFTKISTTIRRNLRVR